MQMREKVGKSRNTMFFQWFGAAEGRKVGSLKRRVRSQLARWEMKKCTPLWREAHVEVKIYNTHHSRTTLEVEMSKKCTRLWREAHFEVKMYKTHHVRTTFGRSELRTQLSIFQGSLAELLCFWCCQVQKLRKSRRTVSFLMLSSSKIEEVSQDCFVFDVDKFKNWGSLA